MQRFSLIPCFIKIKFLQNKKTPQNMFTCEAITNTENFFYFKNPKQTSLHDNSPAHKEKSF